MANFLGVIIPLLVVAGLLFATAPTSTSAAGLGIQAGELTLTATFNSVGLELLFSGDDNGNAQAALEFKPSSSSGWRRGLPLAHTDSTSPPGKAFYGSALLLDDDTSYDLRVSVSDPDGGSASRTGTIRTRADDLPDIGNLTPTHFVRVNGSDGNVGTSATTAWSSLQKAFSAAPAGAVVQVGPGFFTGPTSERTQPLTLVAQFPAVNDEREAINQGQRSVIDTGVVSAPTDSDQPHAGVWQKVTLIGPGLGGAPAGAQYRVWVWRGSGFANATQMGIADQRTDQPYRIASWKPGSGPVPTAEAWAELLYTNRMYNYGFIGWGPDVYLRLPGDRNPNSYYITVGGGDGPILNGPDIRFHGFEVRGFNSGLTLRENAQRAVVERNLFTGNRNSVFLRAANASPDRYGRDHLIQTNRFEDTLKSDRAEWPAVPWRFIKADLVRADGSKIGRVGFHSEGNGVTGRGGAQQVVVRHNTFDGTFNGVNPGYQPDYDRYAGLDLDVHDNLLRRIADDAFEPEYQSINCRIWNNRVEDSAVFLSTGPVYWGPTYVFRNQVWRISIDGVGADNAGETGVGAIFFKRSGESRPQPRLFVLHNTFWTDQPGVSGGEFWAGVGGDPERMYLRNNIFRLTKYPFTTLTNKDGEPPNWDEDYNHFFSADSTRGVKYGSYDYDTVAKYRAASGQGAHTNLVSDFHGPEPEFADAAAGNLALPENSPFVDRGIPVPNLSDRAGQNFEGNAPDLGAIESGFRNSGWQGGLLPNGEAPTPTASVTVPVPVTPTSVPVTATPVPPTATPVPPTATSVPSGADTEAPDGPWVTWPKTVVETRASTYRIEGTAEAGSVVKLWKDRDGDGRRDANESRLVGQMALQPGETGWGIEAPLARGENVLVATATDAAGNESRGSKVRKIIRR